MRLVYARTFISVQEDAPVEQGGPTWFRTYSAPELPARPELVESVQDSTCRRYVDGLLDKDEPLEEDDDSTCRRYVDGLLDKAASTFQSSTVQNVLEDEPLEEDDDSTCRRYVDGLLDKAASTFQSSTVQNVLDDEPLEEDDVSRQQEPSPADQLAVEVLPSLGSGGHPEVCGRPCIRFMHGTCYQGTECQFCHLEHGRPKAKLDKQRRMYMEAFTEAQVLSLLLPYIGARARDQGITEHVAGLITLIEERLRGSEDSAVPPRKSCFLRTFLKRFTLARLVELILNSQQVSEELRASIRTALEQCRSGLGLL